MQIMFSFGMEEAFNEVPLLNRSAGSVRVALQDDSYLFGKAALIHENWDSMKAAVGHAGHRLREHKCKAWSPLCDLLEDSELPASPQSLYQVIPRSRGGLVMLGGAAQGEMETGVDSDNSMLLEKAQCRCSITFDWSRVWLRARAAFKHSVPPGLGRVGKECGLCSAV